jgi:solute carrier family 35 protein E3
MVPSSSTAASGDSKPKYSKAYVSTCLLANVVLSISIILLNKAVYTHVHFPNMTLTFVHFVFTTIGMVICRAIGLFTFKPLPLRQMMPLSLTFCGFVVLTNLSLQSNTVGTYQIIKSMTTPVIIVIQSLFYTRVFSTPVKLTLVPICVGVFLNSYFDIKFNMTGIIYASCGVIVTALYQVWVNEKQRELNCDPMQMLYYQAPMSAFCVAIVIPFFEPIIAEGGIFGTHWSPSALALVSTTGVFAFAINLSIFWIIGITSPVTYNMVGHTKFCLTLLGGYIVFHDPLRALQLCGILLTFSGIVAYTHFKLQEQRVEKEQKMLQADLEAQHTQNNTIHTPQDLISTTVINIDSQK